MKGNDKRIIRTIGAFFLISVLISSVPFIDTRAESVDASEWLFISYMSADVAASPLNWSQDINEMEEGLLNQSIGIAVLVDPVGTNDTKTYWITHDTDSEDIASGSTNYSLPGNVSEAEMGDPDTLISFGEFAIDEYYQGGNIGIILWGHGNGLDGVCLDTGDYLEIEEMSYALSVIKSHLGREIDLVVFDACAMGSIEAISSLCGIASYSVASEIPMPEYGLPYSYIMASISSIPNATAADVGRIFVEEYVKFGKLIMGVTAHATVHDLDRFGDVVDCLELFADEGARFIPIMQEGFRWARNLTVEINGVSTIDLDLFLKNLLLFDQAPQRLWALDQDFRLALMNATIYNDAFVASIDRYEYPGYSLNGLSLFYPSVQVVLDEYENVSEASLCWSAFLREFLANDTYSGPTPGIMLEMTDRHYSDGQADSAVIQWTASAEITEWEFDLLDSMGSFRFLTCEANDSDGEATIDNISAGLYSICFYGLDSDDRYRFYDYDINVTSYREYLVTIGFPIEVNPQTAKLNLTNTRTGTTQTVQISGNQTIVGLIVPIPHQTGDRILIELVEADRTIARGNLTVGEDSAVTLTTVLYDDGLIFFLAFFTISVVAIFLTIKLVRRSRETGKEGLQPLHGDADPKSESAENGRTSMDFREDGK